MSTPLPNGDYSPKATVSMLFVGGPWHGRTMSFAFNSEGRVTLVDQEAFYDYERFHINDPPCEWMQLCRVVTRKPFDGAEVIE